jgi:hypothetical protein
MSDDEVGSVGEEAAKLFTVLSGWARDQGNLSSEAAGATVHGIAEALHGVDQHVATGGEDCRYCPVCQVIHAVRSTSPEVRAHLASAAGSLLHAAAGVLATEVPRSDRPAGVEKIDLGGDDEPRPDQGQDQP